MDNSRDREGPPSPTIEMLSLEGLSLNPDSNNKVLDADANGPQVPVGTEHLPTSSSVALNQVAKNEQGEPELEVIRPPWQLALEAIPRNPIPDPRCFGQTELPNAHEDRIRVSRILMLSELPENERGLSLEDLEFAETTLFAHLRQGLALTVGSALGAIAPSIEECLRAYQVPNRVRLTAGARALAKHAHRSIPPPQEPAPDPDSLIPPESAVIILEGSDIVNPEQGDTEQKKPKKQKVKKKKQPEPVGWWGGIPKGSLSVVNARALDMFYKIMNGATWRNLHWLPHEVLVYEVRVEEGYGMRWSKDPTRKLTGEVEESGILEGVEPVEFEATEQPWMFRGFVEPMMENGHEVGWRHPLIPTNPA